MAADDRRAAIEAIALRRFAATGYHGTSTEAIAKEAGISHAYLFRLFPTKKALFLATAGRTCERILETFRAAADGFAAGEDPDSADVLGAMGKAYATMLGDRELLRAQMQVWVACDDDDIRHVAQQQYGRVVEEVERLSGAGPEEVRAFIAKGMLMNVLAALSVGEIAGEPWVRRLVPMLAEVR